MIGAFGEVYAIRPGTCVPTSRFYKRVSALVPTLEETSWFGLGRTTMTGYTANAEVEIDATSAQVWHALTDPEQIRKFMFDTQVETDWRPGSPIVWKGVYEGTAYEDRGEILQVEDGRLLKVTHFSPLSGQEDRPENYHTLTYELDDRGARTRVRLSQDNNASAAEADHSRDMWEAMLRSLKETVERG